MKKNHAISLVCLVFVVSTARAQNKAEIDSLPTQKLQEVIISSNRLEIPLRQNSKTVQILTADQIRQSGVTHVVDLLQQIAGVDIKEEEQAPHKPISIFAAVLLIKPFCLLTGSNWTMPRRGTIHSTSSTSTNDRTH